MNAPSTLTLFPGLGAAVVLLAFAAPIVPQCPELSGRWQISVDTACGDSFSGRTTINQEACTVRFTFDGVGSARGTIDETTGVVPLDIDLPPSCGGSTIGELRPSGNGFDLFYGDGAPCCRHGGGTLSPVASAPPPPPPRSEPGTLQLAAASVRAIEGSREATLTVRRTGGSDGAVSVDVEPADDTATAGSDYIGSVVSLRWEDGEGADLVASIPLVDDDLLEGSEHFAVRLRRPGGGARIGTLDTARVRIVDDDGNVSGCVSDAETLCLNQGERFRVRMTWRDFAGNAGSGRALPFQRDSGIFYFFDETNAEVLIKVLDACALAGVDSFWVFFAATTNLEYELTVTDTATGIVERYTNPLGRPAPPVLDVAALPVCNL